MRKPLILALLGWLLIGTTALAQSPTCDLNTVADFLQRGDSRHAAEDYDGAIDDFTCALQLDPSNTSALFRRGNVYYDALRYAEAEADFSAVLQINPNDASTYNNRGNIYYYQGDQLRALADYNEAIKLEMDEPSIPYFNRGLLYAEIGKYDAALADFDQSLQLDPTFGKAHLGRARVYLSQGDPQAYNDLMRWIDLTQTRTIDLQLTSGVAQTLQMAEGEVYRVEFDAAAGQVVSAAARTPSSGSVDTLLVILDAAGSPVIGDDDSGVNLDAVIADFTIPSDGAYTLLVTHADGGSDGQVFLTLDTGGETSDTFTTYELEVNETAVVFTTAGDRLNLRSGPGLSFEIIGKLDKDTLVTLLEGPRKADNYAWWRVRTVDGLEGWAVERVEEEQTLQPTLTVGEEALVATTSGDNLNLRSGAGRDFDIVVKLENGAVVTVLEGPQVVDGLRWWKLRAADGLEGWAVDNVDGEQTLVPRPANG